MEGKEKKNNGKESRLVRTRNKSLPRCNPLEARSKSCLHDVLGCTAVYQHEPTLCDLWLYIGMDLHYVTYGCIPAWTYIM